MRQFEEFGKVMAVILGFKKQNNWGKFKEEINDAGKKFTSFEISYIESLSPSAFEKEILINAKLNPDQIKILADLLFEKMFYYDLKEENIQSADLKTKCILLYEKFTSEMTQNEFNLEVHYRLSELKK